MLISNELFSLASESLLLRGQCIDDSVHIALEIVDVRGDPKTVATRSSDNVLSLEMSVKRTGGLAALGLNTDDL